MGMSYRNDVDALAARYDALSTELATKTRELDAARHLLDDAKARARLPVLPNIRVATPCSADWEKMTGDERVRACADCNKNVYNLSNMTRDEAEALIIEKEGKLCVRYFQRKDGTILLKDCVIGVAQKRKRRLIAAGATALLAGGGVLAYKLTRPEPSTAVHHVMQGELVMQPDEGSVSTHEDAPPPAPVDDEVHEIKGKIAVPHDVKMGKIRIHVD
jgi:hypothetical protein